MSEIRGKLGLDVSAFNSALKDGASKFVQFGHTLEKKTEESASKMAKTWASMSAKIEKPMTELRKKLSDGFDTMNKKAENMPFVFRLKYAAYSARDGINKAFQGINTSGMVKPLDNVGKALGKLGIQFSLLKLGADAIGAILEASRNLTGTLTANQASAKRFAQSLDSAKESGVSAGVSILGAFTKSWEGVGDIIARIFRGNKVVDLANGIEKAADDAQARLEKFKKDNDPDKLKETHATRKENKEKGALDAAESAEEKILVLQKKQAEMQVIMDDKKATVLKRLEAQTTFEEKGYEIAKIQLDQKKALTEETEKQAKLQDEIDKKGQEEFKKIGVIEEQILKLRVASVDPELSAIKRSENVTKALEREKELKDLRADMLKDAQAKNKEIADKEQEAADVQSSMQQDLMTDEQKQVALVGELVVLQKKLQDAGDDRLKKAEAQLAVNKKSFELTQAQQKTEDNSEKKREQKRSIAAKSKDIGETTKKLADAKDERSGMTMEELANINPWQFGISSDAGDQARKAKEVQSLEVQAEKARVQGDRSGFEQFDSKAQKMKEGLSMLKASERKDPYAEIQKEMREQVDQLKELNKKAEGMWKSK